jgi:hypothetical protein
MAPRFGPQLIGEAEKTLDAVLLSELVGTGLDQREWVTLRLAAQRDGLDDAGLASAVRERAHFHDATVLVGRLRDQGLVRDGALTTLGHSRLAEIQASITRRTAPIWEGLPADDVAAAARVLDEVISRARAVL